MSWIHSLSFVDITIDTFLYLYKMHHYRTCVLDVFSFFSGCLKANENRFGLLDFYYMDFSTSVELRPAITDEITPTIPREVRRPYEEHLAVHIILANILFLFLPFFFLAHSLSHYLHDNPTLNWTRENASMALVIFQGRLISLNGVNFVFDEYAIVWISIIFVHSFWIDFHVHGCNY